MRTYSIITLGCKVNQYESRQIAELLESHGFVLADDPLKADLRVINTCAVTLEAASKSRHTIKQYIPSDPRQRLVVVGCYSGSEPELQSKIPGISASFSHSDDLARRLSELIEEWEKGKPSPPVGTPAALGTTGLSILSHRQPGNQRALLKIQDGCDANCSYCIIPKLRPRLWSKPKEQILVEIRNLSALGHHEIVLTGIFLSAFGRTTSLRRKQELGDSPLAELIEEIGRMTPAAPRLRLSSLEPGDLSPRLLEAMVGCGKIMPHFHLPLQSGSDFILKRMNRQYDSGEFLEMVRRVNGAFDRPALTTDIIVGFPGETDEEFARTLEVVEEAKFIHIHAFSFSKRPGTAAARWSIEPVPDGVVKRRIGVLEQKAAEYSMEYRKTFVGERVEVIVERVRPGREKNIADGGVGATIRKGRSERYFSVHFESETVQTGDLVTLEIVSVEKGRTLGRLV